MSTPASTSSTASTSRPNRDVDTSSRLAALLTSSVGAKEKGSRQSKASAIQPSVFRPQVKAANRLSCWSSEFYLDTLISTEASIISPRIRQNIDRAILGGLEVSTAEAYGAGLVRFHQFCDEENIPESHRVPASEVLICGFASTMAFAKTSSSTLNTWLAGLRAWTLAQGAPWHGGGSLALEMVKKGVAKNAPASSKLAQRHPVTIKHLNTLVSALNDDNTRDVAVRAAACVAFWGIMRLGEVLIVKSAAFDNVHNVTKATSIAKAETREHIPFIELSIPWTKTTKKDGAIIVLNARPGDPTCPVEALLRHLEVNGKGRDDLPLFAYKSSTPDAFAFLTRDSFVEQCNRIWTRAGLGSLTGHSFRIGGATEMLLQGHPPTVVQKQGRWKSDAFMTYWRNVNEVIPTYISAGIPAEVLERLTRRMDRWFGHASISP